MTILFSMMPGLAHAWMSNSTAILCLLITGVVAAPLMLLKSRVINIIGSVLYGLLTVAWGWYVLAMGYWEGTWFLNKASTPSITMLALNWGLAVLFPVLTMVCRPKPLKKGEKIRVGQFNMLVIVMGMAYGIAFLMIRFWQLNLWATMVFLGLPILYLLTIWLKAKVTPSTALMSIPSAMVALLVLVSAVRQSMAVSMILAVVIDIVLLVVIVYTFGKVGSFLGLDQLFTKYSTSSSSGGSTIGSYNALDDIREKNTIEKNSVWRRDGI